jgi:hypothetical protein
MLGLALVAAAGAGELSPPMGPVQPTMKNLATVEPRTAISTATTPGDATSVFHVTQPGSYYLTADVQGESGKHGILVSAKGTTSIDLNGFSLHGVPGSLDGVSSDTTSLAVRNGAVQSWGGTGLLIAQGIVEQVRAKFNDGHGIRMLWGSVVKDCTAEANGLNGISIGDTSRVSGCVSKGNSGRGIQADGVVTITDCILYSNLQGGIHAGLGNISGCVLFSHNAVSIEITGFVFVSGNTITSTSKGIFATGDRNRIEGNNLVFAVTGIDVEGANNLIIRNSVTSSATAYDIAAGNAFGPIVNVAGMGDVTAAANASHPWANFEY